MHREIELTYSVPHLTFEATTSAWLTATNAAGKLNEYLGEDIGLDRDSAGRFLLYLLAGYTNWVTTYYSHELAHTHYVRMTGREYDFQLDFRDWTLMTPAFQSKTVADETSQQGSEYDLYSAMSGLVQQKLNAREIFKRNISQGAMSYDLGLACLFNNAADMIYILAQAAIDPDLFRQAAYYDPNLSYRSDVDIYLDRVNAGLQQDLSRGEWALTSFAAMALSAHTFDSIIASVRYLANGDRTTAPVSIAAGNTRFYPPNFQVFPHPEGLFINGMFPVHNLLGLDETLYLEYGRVNRAEVDGNRIGFQIDDINFFHGLPQQSFSITHNFGLSTTLGRETVGFSSDIGFNFWFFSRLGIRLLSRYSNGDMLYNDILAKGIERQADSGHSAMEVFTTGVLRF